MKAQRTTTAFAALLLALGCGTPPPTRDADSGPREVAPRPERRAPGGDRSGAGTEALRDALKQALHDTRRGPDLRLVVECSTDQGPRALEVYGNGVAVWNRRRQFELAPDQVAGLLELLLAEDLAALEDLYGKKPQPGLRSPDEQQPGQGVALRVICRVSVDVAGLHKESVQLDRGQESARLRRLAHSLLAACESSAESGIEIEDLQAGLTRLAEGELAPETLHLMLHRKPAPRSTATESRGFLFRLDGATAVTRLFDPLEGYDEPIEMQLEPGALRALAALLAARRAGELPINLYAEAYTDLSLKILDRKRAVQARQFAGLTPTTHGERQVDFETIFNAVYGLHLRVLAEGRPSGGHGIGG